MINGYVNTLSPSAGANMAAAQHRSLYSSYRDPHSPVVNVTSRGQRLAFLDSNNSNHHLHNSSLHSDQQQQSAHLHASSSSAAMYLDYMEEQTHNPVNNSDAGTGSTCTEIEAEIMNAGPVGVESSRVSRDHHQRGGGPRGTQSLTLGRKNNLQSAITSTEEKKRAANGVSGWDQLEITGGVRNLSKSLFLMTHLSALHMANNQISRIPPVIANLKNLNVLDLSHNRIRLLPPEIGGLLQLRQLYLQHNFLRTLPFEIGRLYKLTTLSLDGNPLQSQIYEMYHDVGLEKFLQSLLEQVQENSFPPPERTLMPIFHPLELPRNPHMNVSVMCYNVLCGQYCSRPQYGYCPDWALNWEYRRKGIMGEIRRLNADITCLQEVETDQYYNFFTPQFESEGREGCFVPKSRAKTMSASERSHVDGCAIFFNSAKFEFVESFTVEFSHLAMSYAHSDGISTEASENMLNRVMPKDNVGLVALLRIRNNVLPELANADARFPQTYVLVVNAHVHWDPEYCDVKLIQCIMLSSKLRDIAADVSTRYCGLSQPDPQAVAIIFTGDMNSTPDSGVYEFFMKGHVSFEHEDFKGIRYKQCIARYSSGDKEEEILTHGLELANSYHNVQLNHTNFTLDFKGVIDYIMYSRNHFNCTHVLRPLCREWVESNRIVGFPHPHIPSDHIPLYAEFQLFAHSILNVQREPATEYSQDDYAEAPASTVDYPPSKPLPV